MRPELWTPSQGYPDGARARDFFREQKRRERDRWKHVRDPHIDKIIERQAAIAFDASSEGGEVIGTSNTFSHTCTGTNLALFVGVLHSAVNPIADTITGVTYNGVACTKHDTQENHAGNYALDLWYLFGPATGAHNIVVTPLASTSVRPVAVSFSGVSQTGFPDAYAYSLTTGNASKTETLTTVAASCWMVWFGLDEFNTTETAGAGTTLRQKNGNYGGVFFADSNGSVGAAGSHSLVIVPGSSGDYMNDMVFSIAPSGGGGGTDLSAYVGGPMTVGTGTLN